MRRVVNAILVFTLIVLKLPKTKGSFGDTSPIKNVSLHLYNNIIYDLVFLLTFT